MRLARRLKYRCTKMSFPLVLPHLSVLFSRHDCKESKENHGGEKSCWLALVTSVRRRAAEWLASIAA